MTRLSSRLYVAAVAAYIALLIIGPVPRARASVIIGETVYRTETYTLAGCGPFLRTGGPTILGRGLGVWQAACTYNLAVTDTVVRVCYPSRWDRFWANDGTGKTVTVRPGPGNNTIVVRTETYFCFTTTPPTVPPTQCETSVPLFAYSPDAEPAGQPLAAFTSAALDMRVPAFAIDDSFETILAGFGQAQVAGAQVFADLAARMASLDDPYGLNATFFADYAALSADMTAVGQSLQAGIPAASAPYSTLAATLRTLAADLARIPDPSAYLFAIPHLGFGADAMDRAAGLIDAGLTGGHDVDIAQLSFLQNLDELRAQYQFAPAGVCVPEPSSLMLWAAGCVGLLQSSRSRRRRPATKAA